MGTFSDLAARLTALAPQLDAHIASTGLPPASFDTDSLADLPAHLESTRSALVDAAQDIKRLAQGPRGTLAEILFGFADEISLRAIYTYNIASQVPITGSISIPALAVATSLSPTLLLRLLRPAMANHIFAESPPGHIRHTATSAIIATSPDALAAVGLMTCELSPVGALTLDALKAWPDSEDPAQTAWALRNEIGVPIYEHLAKHPERAHRFGAGMRYFAQGPGWDVAALIRGYDWGSLDVEGAVMVDVGGGQGAVSRRLAEATSHMRFVVQDLPGTVKDGRKALPGDLAGRVEFVAHDFFEEQEVKGASVYFFRWILHNWSDKYCLDILRALVGALKTGSRVLIYEFVLPEGSETRWSQKQPWNLDLLMLAQHNSLERSATQWSALLQRADPRFKLTRIVNLEGSLMSVVEVIWGQSINHTTTSEFATDNLATVETTTHRIPEHNLSSDDELLDQKKQN